MQQHVQEITQLARPSISSEVKERLSKPAKQARGQRTLSQATQNPSLLQEGPGNGNGSRATAVRRYFAAVDDGSDWPPELEDYNKRFQHTLERIKRRHDGVVPTVGKLGNKHCGPPGRASS